VDTYLAVGGGKNKIQMPKGGKNIDKDGIIMILIFYVYLLLYTFSTIKQ
jgi:hypothetical protein